MSSLPSLHGQILDGRYKILEPIATGGMGAVYKGRIEGIGKTVAIKVLHDAALAERFLQEAKAMARLNHPHIIDIWWIGQTESLTYIVMRYVEGETLQQRLKREKLLPIPQGVRILTHILSALQYCHQQGIIHRDLKPANIMIDRFGHSYLMDFGLAKIADDTGLTRTGYLMGTPEYIAPEQIAGSKDLDFRADVYAIGCLMYEIFSGKKAFSGELYAVLNQQLHEEPIPPRNHNPLLPEGLERIILKAMRKKPDQRFSSVDELRARLEKFGGEPESSSISVETPMSPTVVLPPPVGTTERFEPTIQKLVEQLQAEQPLLVTEHLNEMAAGILRDWTVTSPSIERNIEVLQSVEKRLELLTHLGVKLVDYLPPEMGASFGSETGYLFQIQRLAEWGVSSELQRDFSRLPSPVKNRNSKAGMEVLQPRKLLNRLYQGLCFLGTYIVKKRKIPLLGPLFRTTVSQGFAEPLPLIAYPGYEKSLEDGFTGLLDHCVMAVRDQGLMEYFGFREGALRQALIQYDYVRCAWLFAHQYAAYPYYRMGLQERMWAEVVMGVKRHPNVWDPLFDGGAEAAFKKFDQDVGARYGKGTLKP